MWLIRVWPVQARLKSADQTMGGRVVAALHMTDYILPSAVPGLWARRVELKRNHTWCSYHDFINVQGVFTPKLGKLL